MENEEEYAVGLLRRLDDEPQSPSRVDIDKAITDGRRRRLRRAFGVGGAGVLAVAAVAAVPVTLTALRTQAPDAGNQAAATATSATATSAAAVPPVSAPTSCTLARLPIPGGDPKSLVTGADPTGRLILGRSYPVAQSGSYPVLVWENGRPRRVDIPGADQSLTDANSAGIAVGSGWQEHGPTAYVYRAGKVSPLPGSAGAQAQAINDAGQIVGIRDVGANTRPLLWRNASAQPVELSLPGPTWQGFAAAIDEDGTVLGAGWEIHTPPADAGGPAADPKNPGPPTASPGAAGDGAAKARPGEGLTTAYVWSPNGTRRELPKPMVQGAPADSFRPSSIRNGWVTGRADRTTADGKIIVAAVRLNLATGEFKDLPAAEITGVIGNAQGWAVGTRIADNRAALVTDAGQVRLPDLGNHSQRYSNIPLTLSDDGRTIAGQSDNARDEYQAVVWHCR